MVVTIIQRINTDIDTSLWNMPKPCEEHSLLRLTFYLIKASLEMLSEAVGQSTSLKVMLSRARSKSLDLIEFLVLDCDLRDK